MRIVSLVPSATEMLDLLGLADYLVGRSHACDFPPWLSDRPVVTASRIDESEASQAIDAAVRDCLSDADSLYTIDAGLLRRLEPDLLITQDLCDVCAITPRHVAAAIAGMARRPQVVRLAAGDLDDVFADLGRIGRATGREDQATRVEAELRERLAGYTVPPAADAPRVLFLEWLDPAFGAGHWNPELISRAGGHSVLDVKPGEKSTVISHETLESIDPDLIFVAACGFDAARARSEWEILSADHPVRRMHQRTDARLVFADGNAYFNRPGPRLVESLQQLAAAVRSCG